MPNDYDYYPDPSGSGGEIAVPSAPEADRPDTQLIPPAVAVTDPSTGKTIASIGQPDQSTKYVEWSADRPDMIEIPQVEYESRLAEIEAQKQPTRQAEILQRKLSQQQIQDFQEQQRLQAERGKPITTTPYDPSKPQAPAIIRPIEPAKPKEPLDLFALPKPPASATISRRTDIGLPPEQYIHAERELALKELDKEFAVWAVEKGYFRDGKLTEKGRIVGSVTEDGSIDQLKASFYLDTGVVNQAGITSKEYQARGLPEIMVQGVTQLDANTLIGSLSTDLKTANREMPSYNQEVSGIASSINKEQLTRLQAESKEKNIPLLTLVRQFIENANIGKIVSRFFVGTVYAGTPTDNYKVEKGTLGGTEYEVVTWWHEFYNQRNEPYLEQLQIYVDDEGTPQYYRIGESVPLSIDQIETYSCTSSECKWNEKLEVKASSALIKESGLQLFETPSISDAKQLVEQNEIVEQNENTRQKMESGDIPPPAPPTDNDLLNAIHEGYTDNELSSVYSKDDIDKAKQFYDQYAYAGKDEEGKDVYIGKDVFESIPEDDKAEISTGNLTILQYFDNVKNELAPYMVQAEDGKESYEIDRYAVDKRESGIPLHEIKASLATFGFDKNQVDESLKHILPDGLISDEAFKNLTVDQFKQYAADQPFDPRIGATFPLLTPEKIAESKEYDNTTEYIRVHLKTPQSYEDSMKVAEIKQRNLLGQVRGEGELLGEKFAKTIENIREEGVVTGDRNIAEALVAGMIGVPFGLQGYAIESALMDDKTPEQAQKVVTYVDTARQKIAEFSLQDDINKWVGENRASIKKQLTDVIGLSPKDASRSASVAMIPSTIGLNAGNFIFEVAKAIGGLVPITLMSAQLHNATGESDEGAAQLAELAGGFVIFPILYAGELAKTVQMGEFSRAAGQTLGLGLTFVLGGETLINLAKRAKTAIDPRYTSSSALAVNVEISNVKNRLVNVEQRRKMVEDVQYMLANNVDNVLQVLKTGKDVKFTTPDGQIHVRISGFQRAVRNVTFHATPDAATLFKSELANTGKLTTKGGEPYGGEFSSPQLAGQFFVRRSPKDPAGLATIYSEKDIAYKLPEGVYDFLQQGKLAEAKALLVELERNGVLDSTKMYRVWKWTEGGKIEFELWKPDGFETMVIPEAKIPTYAKQKGEPTAVTYTNSPLSYTERPNIVELQKQGYKKVNDKWVKTNFMTGRIEVWKPTVTLKQNQKIPVYWVITKRALEEGKGMPSLPQMYRAEALAVATDARKFAPWNIRFRSKTDDPYAVATKSPYDTKLRTLEMKLTGEQMSTIRKPAPASQERALEEFNTNSVWDEYSNAKTGDIEYIRPPIEHPTKSGTMRTRVNLITVDEKGNFYLGHAYADNAPKTVFSVAGGGVHVITEGTRGGKYGETQVEMFQPPVISETYGRSFKSAAMQQGKEELGLIINPDNVTELPIYLGKGKEYGLPGERVFLARIKEQTIDPLRFNEEGVRRSPVGTKTEIDAHVKWNAKSGDEIMVYPEVYDFFVLLSKTHPEFGIDMGKIKIWKGDEVYDMSMVLQGRDAEYASRFEKGKAVTEDMIRTVALQRKELKQSFRELQQEKYKQADLVIPYKVQEVIREIVIDERGFLDLDSLLNAGSVLSERIGKKIESSVKQGEDFSKAFENEFSANQNVYVTLVKDVVESAKELITRAKTEAEVKALDPELLDAYKDFRDYYVDYLITKYEGIYGKYPDRLSELQIMKYARDTLANANREALKISAKPKVEPTLTEPSISKGEVPVYLDKEARQQQYQERLTQALDKEIATPYSKFFWQLDLTSYRRDAETLYDWLNIDYQTAYKNEAATYIKSNPELFSPIFTKAAEISTREGTNFNYNFEQQLLAMEGIQNKAVLYNLIATIRDKTADAVYSRYPEYNNAYVSEIRQLGSSDKTIVGDLARAAENISSTSGRSLPEVFELSILENGDLLVVQGISGSTVLRNIRSRAIERSMPSLVKKGIGTLEISMEALRPPRIDRTEIAKKANEMREKLSEKQKESLDEYFGGKGEESTYGRERIPYRGTRDIIPPRGKIRATGDTSVPYTEVARKTVEPVRPSLQYITPEKPYLDTRYPADYTYTDSRYPPTTPTEKYPTPPPAPYTTPPPTTYVPPAPTTPIPPIKPPNPRIIIKLQEKYDRLSDEQKLGAIAWKQGWIYKLWYNPFGQKDIINSRYPIPQVQYYTGIGSAYKSAIFKGGKVPQHLKRDMGIMDIDKSVGTGEKPILEFSVDEGQTKRKPKKRKVVAQTMSVFI